MTAIVPTASPVRRRLSLVEPARVVSLDAHRARRYFDDVTADEHAATWSAILGRIVEPAEAMRLGVPTFPGGAA